VRRHASLLVCWTLKGATLKTYAHAAARAKEQPPHVAKGRAGDAAGPGANYRMIT